MAEKAALLLSDYKRSLKRNISPVTQTLIKRPTDWRKALFPKKAAKAQF